MRARGFHMTERLDVGELPADSHARLIHLTNVFGRVLFGSARAPSLKRVGSLPEPIQREAAEISDGAIYGALQVLDGVIPPIGNVELDIKFVLTARLRDRKTRRVVEEIELGPDGEGLCMGFAGWTAGDFGSLPP
jgi:hypothetical protein